MRRPEKPAPAREPAAPEQDVSRSAAPEGFASRWSRRKLAARQFVAEPAPAEGSAAADPVPAEEPAPPGDADMPPIESLTEDSDVSGFFSPRVSEELRKLALRRLFRTSKFNVRDGLDDYDGDFRSFTPLGDVVTADMRHQLERQAEQAKRLLAGESGQDARGPAAETMEGAKTAQAPTAGETPRTSEDDDPDPGEHEVQS